jgi:molecular chaperone DnaK (HSP70)
VATKDFFVSAIQLVQIDGSKNVPTVLFYHGQGTPLIGSAAMAAAHAQPHLLTGDFKVDLGNADPASKTTQRRRFSVASGAVKTAGDLTADFLHRLLLQVRQHLELVDLDAQPALLLAEPLAMGAGAASPDWLTNYRHSLERILSGQGFKSVDFLPEPFAVFQYYRYGLKHPLLAGAGTHNALVIDFGGGTFDVCVVQTTKEGDIAKGGRLSKPLAADSVPFGGFSINRMIAEALLRKHADCRDRQSFSKGLEYYRRWRDGLVTLDVLDNRFRAFIEHLERMARDTEDLKLAMCRSITDWSLTATLQKSVSSRLPKHPFEPGFAGHTSLTFTAHELRSLFVDDIWARRLRPVISRTLSRAEEELAGAPVTIVLLSGGSANIGWLTPLLKRDFHQQLARANILHLEDYQEVVAKGLAIECARRHYSPDGDFKAVTYNRLHLFLAPDGEPPSPKRFKPRDSRLPDVSDHPGLLLPSASVLRAFSNEAMEWKVRLDQSPRHRLGYWFTREQCDPSNSEDESVRANLHNVEQTSVSTPPQVKAFDSELKIRLRVEPDGTAKPSFIYRSGRTPDEAQGVEARPFYLDMTYNADVVKTPAYLGVDFGTSNSSVSYVSAAQIDTYSQRAKDAGWLGLQELLERLPSPMSLPLAVYLGTSSDPDEVASRSLDFVEGALAILAYGAYLESCSRRGRSTSVLFKGFTQRSVGPLLGLIRDLSNGPSLGMFQDCVQLVSGPLADFVNRTVTELAQFKHKKADSKSIDTFRLCQIVANVSARVFQRQAFGFFEDAQAIPFQTMYQGRFRVAAGTGHFNEWVNYECTKSLGREQAFIANRDSKSALPMFPLVFWMPCSTHPDLTFGHCYLYDRYEPAAEVFTFKAAESTCQIAIEKDGVLSPVWNALTAARATDPRPAALMLNRLGDAD